MYALILLSSISAEPNNTTKFTVTNKCSSSIVVSNKCSTVQSTTTVAPATRPTVIRATVGDGHTHTCANGHTWSHSENPTHNCQVCGLHQYTQDASPRVTNLSRGESIGYSLTGVSGGCVNGSCTTPVIERRGLFGRRK